jgi:hypothetical protein
MGGVWKGGVIIYVDMFAGRNQILGN